jgi:hypothetical protein
MKLMVQEIFFLKSPPSKKCKRHFLMENWAGKSPHGISHRAGMLYLGEKIFLPIEFGYQK